MIIFIVCFRILLSINGEGMAGGSQIVINKNGITFITPAKFEVKAGQHRFEGGQKKTVKIPSLPVLNQSYILQYLVKNKDNIPLSNKPYFIIDQDGKLQKGVTDSDGLMQLHTTASAQTLMTHVMTNEIEEAQEAGGEEE